MDVERLMNDLTVDQLHNIQMNLQTEIEGKKEELREMVGRRYRDVLEASTEVRHVRKLAEDLAEAVACARATQSVVETRPLSREQQTSIQRFIALHKLLSVIGGPDGDALSDAFSFTLVELLHKQLVAESLPPSIQSVVSALTGRIIRTRQQLLRDLEDEIGELSEPNWVANQMTALGLLQGVDYERLLDCYFKSRENYIASLAKETSSILSVIAELKQTLIIVEHLFVQGELIRIIHATASSTYRPSLIDLLIGDEPFTFGRVMVNETEKVTRQFRDSKASPLLTQKINTKCVEWINRVCNLVRDLVLSICEFHVKANDMIEFVTALSGVLCKEWPRISSYNDVYQNLFNDLLFQKFMSIISRDLHELESRFVSQLKSTNIAPPPLFEKSSNKFDSLMGTGISNALQQYANVRQLCIQYEQVGMDVKPGHVKELFAAELFAVFERLSKVRLSDAEEMSLSELSRARICLALLHCNSASFCQAMNKDGSRIASASRILNAAAEDSLSNFACEVAKECLSQQVLQPYMDSFAHPANGLQIALEWERLELEEIGAIEIPVVLSPVLQTALFTLSCRYGDACVAHLLSRGVRKRLAAQIAELVAAIVQEIINTADAVQRTWIQLLFDCRVLNVMFPDDRLIKLIPQIESRIDPFDLSILSKYLARNARLAVSKSLLMYSCFLVDFTHSKEDQDSQPSSQVIDVAPKSYYPPRIPLIPRLGRTAADSAARRVENAKIPRNKLLTTTNLSGMKTTPSLSSFVDKISSSWFGSN